MAFAGLKKQINKANQYVTEKMGGAEGTKLDMDFMEMERKCDVTVELVEELQLKTKEYLQPNPTARAKMAAVKGISKLSGQAKSNTYPQPEGILAECMLTYGKKLGEDSVFAVALVEFGEALKQMADVKYALDDNIKQNVLEPLHHLQTKDLKEVMHHRKKLQGRRLDFDCKRRRQAKDDEIRSAEEKFAESLQLAQIGMFHLLENDEEQVSQLVTFSEAMLEYHSQCAEILKVLHETLQEKREEAEARPKSEFIPKTLEDLEGTGAVGTNGGGNNNKYGLFGNNNCVNNGGGQFANKSDRQFGTNNASHHQLYSSQQNLNTLLNSNNNSNNNNNNTNYKNSNFARNRVYGSQQSLASAKSQTHKSANLPNIPNADLDSSVDWLNAWNSPPAATATSRPAPAPKANAKLSINFNNNNNSHFSSSHSSSVARNNDPWTASPLPSPMRSPAKTPATNKQPCCQALYDFEPENPGELGFKENDIIQLLNRVDENWYEGTINGRTGYFPQSYVQIVVPIPN